MTAYNRHLLAEGAYKANREAAAREEREAVVKFLRLEAELSKSNNDSDESSLLTCLAKCIENGDHLR